MNLDLAGRVAMVTGGSKGIGRAIAISLAKEGVNLIIFAREKKSLLTTKKEIEKYKVTVEALSVDVMEAVSVKKAIEKSLKKVGRLDILVNNVGGVKRFAGFDELTDQDWLYAFRLNVLSMVYFVKYTRPWLVKSKAPRIINISSISGVAPGSYNPHYTTVKAAELNLSKYLANLFADDKILVNAVCPGPVHSSAWDRNVERQAKILGISQKEARKKIEEEETGKIRLGRIGEGEDVANMVTFLASDKASWITGSCFHINGGKLNTIF